MVPLHNRLSVARVSTSGGAGGVMGAGGAGDGQATFVGVVPLMNPRAT